MAINPRVSNLGRIMMVDPNPEGNGTVNLEDLSIIVELDTESKGRSVVNVDSNQVSSTSTSSDKTTVKFIDGTKAGKNKNLTTNYTEVNTTFNKKGNDLESLGITDIDIAFNSSYAPMIKINFIDVRGNSVFERGNESDYRVFFDLPYPIFKLTVKGYYGKAVTYCLHMTKWNSLFNSDTGNYEIVCEFVGYTYAILTDLLIGYLKGIGETPRGRAKLGKYRLPDGGGVSDGDGNIRIPTILELLQIISKVNKEVKSIKNNNADVKQLKLADENAKDIEKIKNVLDTFVNTINQNGSGQEITVNNLKGIIVIPSTNDTVLVNQRISHIKNITNLIETTNLKLSSSFKLDINKFNNVPLYTGVLLADLKSYPKVTNNESLRVLNRLKNKDGKLFNILSSKIGGKFSGTAPLNVVDLSTSYQAISGVTNDLNSVIKLQKENVANILKDEIPKIIGFKPTIANMLAIFTAHGEVFLDAIKDVAIETTNDKQRTSKLTSFETSDISEQTSKKSTGNPSGDMEGEIFPFPEFTTKDGTEVWVGDKVTIPETEFIEELLRGMLDYSKSEEDILNRIKENNLGWYSVNPIDSELGGSFENPYLSSTVSNTNDVNIALRLAAQRAIIYLGYTTSDYAGYELRTMARLEANSLYNSLLNDVTKDSFANTFLKGSDLLSGIVGTDSTNNLNGLNNNKNNPFGTMLTPSPTKGYLSYNYIRHLDPIKLSTGSKLMPKSYINITEPFDGNNFLSEGLTVSSKKTAENADGGIYISNYANDDVFSKPIDGATYVKLINTETYINNTNSYPNYDGAFSGDSAALDTSETLDLTFLGEETPELVSGRKDSFLKYNSFTSSYKTNDFTKIIYNNSDYGLTGPSSSMYLFYGDSAFGGRGEFTPNSGLYNQNDRDNSSYDLSGYTIGTAAFTNFSNLGRSSYGGTNKVNLETSKLKRNLLNTNATKNVENIYNIDTGKRDGIYMPFIDYYTYSDASNNIDNRTPYQISLFGSELYYAQESEEAKAFLFLHTLPFNGITNNFQSREYLAVGTTTLGGQAFDEGKNGLFRDTRLLNLFKRRGGVIEIPKAWLAFVGGLLWRHDTSTADPIKWSGTGVNYIGGFNSSDTNIPTKGQYLRIDELDAKSMSFGVDDEYTELEPVFIGLPSQVKQLFIDVFFDFVNGEANFSGIGWSDIKSGLEVIDVDNFSGVNGAMNTLQNTYTDFLGSTPLTNETNLKNYKVGGVTALKNIDNYNIVNKYTSNPRGVPSYDEIIKNNIFLEHKANTTSMNSVLDLLVSTSTMLNTTWRIWNTTHPIFKGQSSIGRLGTDIEVNTDDITAYFNAFRAEFIRLNIADLNERKAETDNIKSELFNSIDNDKIKLNLYRNVKAIYDKWVAGTSDVLAHCGGGNISKKEIDSINSTGGKLINSFHFLSKSFIDIGDKFFINPLGIIDNISGNFNQSLYDLVGRTLSDNDFNFNPLPSFINFKDPKEMEEMFTPFPYSKAISASTVGPSFVCTYVGDRSKHLDLGEEASYSNDGFDFKTDGSGGIQVDAKAYTEGTLDKEMSIPVFAVNYGDQNQSIFKNIKLNQQEYSETDESLHIMDDISKGGSPNSKTYMGQNMFNVYSTRSYSAEIEMLGNATIQPMMYFQLNSIPMFHGAFLITSVRHKIKPNHMTTFVTGVRVRKQDIPLIDEKTVYMNFVDITDDVKTDGVTLSPAGEIPEWNYNENITKIVKS